MKRIRSLTSAVIAVCLAASAEAQIPYEQFQPQNEVAKPTGAAGSLWTRCVSGDVTGDRVADVALLANGTVAFFFDPFSFAGATVANFGQTVTDLEIEPSTTDAPCALLSVGASGLRRLAIDPATGNFATYTTIATGNWTNAKIVRSAQIDLSGGVDYVGVASDGHTIIVRRYSTSGMQETTFSSFNSSTVQDVALLNWDANSAGLEIALLTSYGIEVYSQAGAFLRKSACPGIGSDAFTPVTPIANGPRALAWLVRTSSTTQGLYVYRSNQSPTLQVQVANVTSAFDGSLAVSMVANDANGDGAEELAVAHQAHYSPRIFKNLATPTSSPTSPWFTIADSHYIVLPPNQSEFAAPASINLASLVYRDLDNDGYKDLVVPMEPFAKIKVVRGYDPALDVNPSAIFTSGVIHESQSGKRVVDIDFQIPSTMSIPSGTNSIDALIWTGGVAPQNSGNGLNEDVAAYWTKFIVVQTSGPYYATGTFSLELDGISACALPQTYWIDFRIANRTWSGNVPQSLNPNDVAIVRIGATSSSQSALAYLANVANPPGLPFIKLTEAAASSCTCTDYSSCGFNSGTTPLPVSVVEKRYLPPTATGGLPRIPVTTQIKVALTNPP